MIRRTPPAHDAPAAPTEVAGEPPPTVAPPVDARVRRFGFEGSLRERAARGTLINTAFLIGLSALSLCKGFVLAGFLSRADYGLWGVLTASLGTLLWLKNVGIGDKYIQQDEDDQEAAFQKAFTLELFFTAALIALLAAALPIFVLVYDQPKMIAPGLAALVPLVAGAFQVPLWVFYRRMQFARQRALQAIDPIVGFAVSVGVAAAGGGYWAFVLGLIAGSCASAAASVAFSPFKLRLRYEPGTLRSYASFSWPLLIASGSSIVMAQSAVLTAETHLGLAATGVIALAANITAFTDRVDHLVTGTLYPAICAVKDRTTLLFESFVKSNRLALMWAVPFGTALTLFCADLVTFGIGERWRPAVAVLQVYGIAAAIHHIGFNWSAYFNARGETKPIAVGNVSAMVAFLLIGIPLLLRFGLRGFAAGMAVHAFVLLCVRTYYLKRLFATFRFLPHAVRAFLPTLPAVAAVLLLRALESGERTFAMAMGELLLYIGVTVVATWYFESRLLREAVGYLRRQPAAAAST